MPRDDPVRAALDRHLKRLEEKLVEEKREPAAGDLGKLDRLARLIALRDVASKPRRSTGRWPAIAVVVGTLLGVSFLLFFGPEATEIELVVATTEFHFVSPGMQHMKGMGGLGSLGLAGAEEVDIPRYRGGAARTVTGSGRQAVKMRLSVATLEADLGGISLDDIHLAKGTRVRFSLPDRLGKHDLILDGAPAEVIAVVNGAITLAIPSEGEVTRDFGAGGGSLEARGGALSLDLEPAAGDGVSYADQLDVESLSFLRVDEHETASGTLVRQVSTIESGRLFLEELDGQAIDLRRGERLRFKRSEGWIRELGLRDGVFHVAFHGWVEGMTTGTNDNPRSLMPSWLEWIKAHHEAALFWAAILYVSGFALGLLRWLGVAT